MTRREKELVYIYPGGTARASHRHVYALSDGTAATCEAVLVSCLLQFKDVSVTIHKIPRIRDTDELHDIILDASREEAAVLFTFVKPELVRWIYTESVYYAVPTIDLLGPVFSRLEALLKLSPMGVPGLLRRTVDDEYFKRISTIDFGVKHDDGLGLHTIRQADVVLLGVSRSSKTPIAMYLCYCGIKAANCPLVLDTPVPEHIVSLPPGKLVGLLIEPGRLREVRKARLEAMPHIPADYTDPATLRRELDYCRRAYARLDCPVVDVTYKSIEECATEILRLLRSRGVSLGRGLPV